jgi:hypothetical protein
MKWFLYLKNQNFFSIKKEWADQLFFYGHNPLLRNLSSLECLEKFHSKIINSLVDDRFDKKAIPVRRYLSSSSFLLRIFLLV